MVKGGGGRMIWVNGFKWVKMGILVCVWLATAVMVDGCATSQVERKWSVTNYISEGAYQVAHVVDYGQTLYISRHPDEYHEHSLFLGKHPSTDRVHAVMIAEGVGHVVVSAMLKEPYRTMWQTGTLGWTLYLVGRNAGLGIRVGF